MYLWHFPLFIYLDHARTGLTGYPLFAVRVAATLVVATGSFYLIERPIRQGTLLPGWRSWAVTPLAVVGTAAALVAATSVPGGGGEGADRPPASRRAGDRDTGQGAGGRGLHRPDPRHRPQRYARDYGVDRSTAGSWVAGSPTAPSTRKRVWTLPWRSSAAARRRTQWPALWKADIAKDHPNVVMILAGRWEVSNRTYDGHWTNIENPTYAAYVQRQLEYAVAWPAPAGPRSS